MYGGLLHCWVSGDCTAVSEFKPCRTFSISNICRLQVPDYTILNMSTFMLSTCRLMVIVVIRLCISREVMGFTSQSIEALSFADPGKSATVETRPPCSIVLQAVFRPQYGTALRLRRFRFRAEKMLKNGSRSKNLRFFNYLFSRNMIIATHVVTEKTLQWNLVLTNPPVVC